MGPYTPDQCRVCWLYLNDEIYRVRWGGDSVPANRPPGPLRTLPCVFLGEVLDTLRCPCPAKWLRACALHRVCTLEVCKTCADYQDDQGLSDL